MNSAPGSSPPSSSGSALCRNSWLVPTRGGDREAGKGKVRILVNNMIHIEDWKLHKLKQKMSQKLENGEEVISSA